MSVTESSGLRLSYATTAGTGLPAYFGGIIIAGLALVDVTTLAERLGLPVLVVTRRNPVGSDVADALRAASLGHRLALLERIPRAEAERLVRSSLAKSRLPEPLRVAHLIGQAPVLGESRGRV